MVRRGVKRRGGERSSVFFIPEKNVAVCVLIANDKDVPDPFNNKYVYSVFYRLPC